MQSKQYEIYTGSQTGVLLIDLVEVTGVELQVFVPTIME